MMILRSSRKGFRLHGNLLTYLGQARSGVHKRGSRIPDSRPGSLVAAFPFSKIQNVPNICSFFMSASTSEGIALITGSSQGIGKAIAIRLASDGFEIAINDIPAKSLTLEATQKEIQELTGKRALICVGDVSVEEEVKGMIEEVVKSLGGIDVVNIVVLLV